MKAMIRKVARIVTGIFFGLFLLGTLACILQRRDLGTILFGAACAALFGYLYNRLRLHKPKRAAPQSRPVTTAPTYSRPSVSYTSTPAASAPATPRASSAVSNDPPPPERIARARTLYKKHIHDYVVFDMETNGLDASRNRIVEIAAYRVRDSRIAGDFHTLVNPGVHIPQDVSAIHGITDADVQTAPKSAAAIRAFLDFCGDDILISYNSDRLFAPMLIKEAARAKIPFENKFADARWIANIYFPDFDGYTLADLCQHIHYSLSMAHPAAEDARAVFAVVEAGRQRFHENPAL